MDASVVRKMRYVPQETTEVRRIIGGLIVSIQDTGVRQISFTPTNKQVVDALVDKGYNVVQESNNVYILS